MLDHVQPTPVDEGAEHAALDEGRQGRRYPAAARHLPLRDLAE